MLNQILLTSTTYAYIEIKARNIFGCVLSNTTLRIRNRHPKSSRQLLIRLPQFQLLTTMEMVCGPIARSRHKSVKRDRRDERSLQIEGLFVMTLTDVSTT